MKNLFFVTLLILSIVTLYSCSKNNSENNGLVGNWNVVNDSSLNTNKFLTVPIDDSVISSSNYSYPEVCRPNFNFNSNGTLIASYGFGCTYALPLIDSAKYIVSNNQVAISIYAQTGDCCSPFTNFNPAITRTYIISNLTPSTATLTYSQLINSSSQKQSIATEIINLKK